MNENGNGLETGYVVKVGLKDGRTYEGFVVESYLSNSPIYEGAFLVRVLNSKDKIGAARDLRYGVEGREMRFESMKDVDTISIIKKPTIVRTEGFNFYRTDTSRGTLTFCMSEGYGGWSNVSDFNSSLIESAERATTDSNKLSVLKESL